LPRLFFTVRILIFFFSFLFFEQMNNIDGHQHILEQQDRISNAIYAPALYSIFYRTANISY
jgi:hypothetical protein